MKREWLKKARKKKLLTLKKAAELAGCSFNYLSDLENGRRNPSLKMAARIAAVLDFSVIRFFEEEQKSA